VKLTLPTVLLLLAVAPAAPVIHAQDYTGTDGPPIRFRAILSADEQSAPTESPGIGCVLFTLDRPTLKLDWTMRWSKLTSAATGAHVHGPQTPGGNAGVLFNLAPDGLDSPISGSTELSEAHLKYILTMRAYVNIHTSRYPGGELRGQIMRIRPEDADVGCDDIG
jgi:hypothetical protein